MLTKRCSRKACRTDCALVLSSHRPPGRIGCPEDKGREAASRVQRAVSMTEELPETLAVSQVYFVVPGVGYIRAFKGIQVGKANWS